MSNYEWEGGEILLPPAAARSIRAALAEEHTAARERALREVEGFLTAKGAGGRTRESFQQALATWYDGRDAALERQRGSGGWGFDARRAAEVAAQQSALDEAHAFLDARGHQGLVARPSAGDLKQAFPPAPKGTKAVYQTTWATVAIDGNKLRWNVPENNHAVESAREHPLARRLFAELDKVEWTKGTGGALLYNNEYAEDAGRYHEGAGGSRASARYGPLGDPNYVTKEQAARLEQAAQKWRAKSPDNRGKCGRRTMVNGRPSGRPCQNYAHSCPSHGGGRSRRW